MKRNLTIKKLIKSRPRLTLLATALITLIGCTSHQPHFDFATDNDGYNQADSIVSAIGDQRDFTYLLRVTDSLKQSGELSKVRAIFYSTIAYNLMGQHNHALRLYYQLGNIDVKTLNCKADFDSYIYSCKDYVRLLCDMRRYDRALRVANDADRKLKEAGYDTFTNHHDIAQMIGESLLYLDQSDEADKYFQKSLQGIHARLATNNDPLDLRECQKTMNAIAKAYIEKSIYDKAEPWIKVQDSLYAIADTHPKRDSIYVDEMKAEINYSKALLAFALGHTADAEHAYRVFQSTQTAKELSSVINCNEYLMLTQRYNEAAHNYEQLDHFLLEGGYKANLENFGHYMLPKFRANMLAGRRDTALKVANLVADYYDTALVRQKMIDADLLSTVYDTEGKERQIAEQRAKLSHQRLLTLTIITIIIVIFFHIYIIQRRRAYRKLNATNQQLILANERAEESSRMKTRFIQQISHEVRTPLNVLSGFSQVLATPDIRISSDELQSISQKIVENSERITHLVDKMLDLSQINSNTIIECHDTVSVTDMAKQAIDKSGISQASHLQFQLHVSAEAQSISIVTHQTSAVKTLVLLLDNAIKFTHPLAFKGHQERGQKQRVALNVSANQQHVLFTVEDTGIGIPPEQAENIFLEFVQLNEYSDGTGIGLPIARSLARHLGGDILFDKAYTGGARFVMMLPLQKNDQ